MEVVLEPAAVRLLLIDRFLSGKYIRTVHKSVACMIIFFRKHQLEIDLLNAYLCGMVYLAQL